MIKYLIVQLDDSSVSFCHYSNKKNEKRLIPSDVLEKAVLWAMKENVTIQYLYPHYTIPADYKEYIGRTFHADIVPDDCEDYALKNKAEVVVFDAWEVFANGVFNSEQAYVIRTTFAELLANSKSLGSVLAKLCRLSVVITDIAGFTGESEYRDFLEEQAMVVLNEYKKGHNVQLNLLTDRIFLDSMNNCNAGEESITLAPDGKFYVCPAFYFEGKDGYSIGDIESGLDIKNKQLYRLDHAPICRICDAFQCRRCVWLNRKLTLEVNTPSHEQCVMAHLERNASRKLLDEIRKLGQFMPEKEIPQLDYLDPFEVVVNNNRDI